MAQCREHSPHTTLAWVRFTDLVSRLGWVFRWFSSLLRGLFSVSSVSPSTKTNIWILIQPENSGQEEPTRGISIAKLFNPINIVIVIIFVSPTLPIYYVLSTHCSCYPSSSWIFTQTFLFCSYATSTSALLIIKISLRGYSLQCNGVSTRNLIITITIIIITIVIIIVINIIIIRVLQAMC